MDSRQEINGSEVGAAVKSVIKEESIREFSQAIEGARPHSCLLGSLHWSKGYIDACLNC